MKHKIDVRLHPENHSSLIITGEMDAGSPRLAIQNLVEAIRDKKGGHLYMPGGGISHIPYELLKNALIQATPVEEKS